MGIGGSSAVCAALGLALAVVVMACASLEEGSASNLGDSPGRGAQGGAGGCVGVGCGAAGGGIGGGGGAPPEREVESAFRSPVATGRFVWATNPVSGRVARIDANSFEVRTVEAGFGPTYLAAVPGPQDAPRAIVLNVRSNDATLLIADASGNVTTQSVPVHAGANAWAISGRGRWAIAWSDVTLTSRPDPTEGFQDITVIDLGGTAPRATRLSVGYRPTRIYIAADESRAFAVTEPGITAIELAAASGPMVSRDITVTDDPFAIPAARDVSVTPDGALALVRHDGSRVVGVVTLATGDRVSIAMPAAVSDLDLTDDGTRAVAVMRGGDAHEPMDGGAGAGADAALDAADASNASDAGDANAGDAGDAGDARTDSAPPLPVDSKVAVLPIPGIATSPASFEVVTIPGERVGSVTLSPDGRTALLYTNAFDNDRMTILSLAEGAGRLSHRTVSLKAPVRAVFAAPDASHAIALLEPGAGSAKPGAFSIVPIASNLPPKIQGTEAVPVSVAIAPGAAGRALVTVSDENARVFATYLARMPELLVDRLPLASAPLATGIVPAAGSGFVAERHPEGRITFVQLASGKARTLTGFELGAKVVDGQR